MAAGVNDKNSYDSRLQDVTQEHESSAIQPDDASLYEQPQIGRYRVKEVLGKGGFGLVYLARDEQLDRLVAIKVPHSEMVSKPADVKAYLTEARTVANLDHPGIVPVHDVGSTEQFPCYTVSKYIKGTDLSALLKQKRMKYHDAAELVATVAEALHYAHKQGLVHRDVKPGNILINDEGKAFVVDFGLALREENIGKGPKYAGTPAYMSPEQARGEGHRVDGRSDIFSLGIVFYELLAGRQPFRGDTKAELFKQLTSYEAKPLRQYDEKLPKELERICHKAMAKRASDRYSSAHDLAEDLQAFLAEQTVVQSDTSAGGVGLVASETDLSPLASNTLGSLGESSDTLKTGSSSSQLVKIVPKGLRSFDAHDADFFLELLPGPRDRNGLPDSLRFWKTRIEETDPDHTFSVGLIYGPSGCGKSSLVKAGLLPRLAEDIIPIYIEATPEETENRLLHGLRKNCPALEKNLSLVDSLASLRRGLGLPVGKKVLIILDQFEQWLHAKKEEDVDLVQALRQCDGGRVQCVVMVRDDFWLAVSRFLRELEIRLLEGRNIALVDLFDPDHARKVLAALGRALGRLPENIGDATKAQEDFLDQAVAGLAEDGKIICVRLALFAEMMKSKAWTISSLREVGGTKGIGFTFLEESFSSPSASPDHRYHQKAARAVLRDLLPDAGSDIKGYMRSHAELLKASGYKNRLKDFDDLIHILDSEIRLITPTDPEGKDDGDESVLEVQAGQKYYQLAHDYLVHSLRDWLTRKQKETRRGRAELKLRDASTVWNAKPGNRFLPSWWGNLELRLLTNKQKWTEPQRRMMGKAGRVHGVRFLIALAATVAVLLGGMRVRNAANERQRDAEATRLVEGLLRADTAQVKAIIGNLDDYWQYANDDLETAFKTSPNASNAKLHAALAMLPDDNSVLSFLSDRLLMVPPDQFTVVRDLIAVNKAELIDGFWEVATDSGEVSVRRFQAACALATYDPENDKWRNPEFVEFVAGYLVEVLPSELLPRRDALRPVGGQLVASLAKIYRDEQRGEQVRSFATDTLADYLSADAAGLFDLLSDADEKQFGTIFHKLDSHREQAVALGNAEVTKVLAAEASQTAKESLARRQANAAVMLLRMESPEQVWSLLKHSPDPRVRSYIVHWISQRGGDVGPIVERFKQERDVTIKRALLLCLGGFKLPDSQQSSLVKELLDVYRNHPDAGMHAASEWVLRKWGQGEAVLAIDLELKQVGEQPAVGDGDQRQWFINGQGQTFVAIDADKFQMGSPDSETGRGAYETLHQSTIGRRFAMSTKEVTRAEWRKFVTSVESEVYSPDQERLKVFSSQEDSPMIAMEWFEAAWYCNWLSEQEGIPRDQWCYEPNDQGIYGPGMKAKENFWELKGYRLPTESEWEYACRAGASTRRYYGEADSLLANYAWFQAVGENHSWPVGRLKPNDWGLFDMHGNVIEWCYDAFTEDVSSPENVSTFTPKTGAIAETETRLLRGGSYYLESSSVRSAYRYSSQPTDRIFTYGLRPVRTLGLRP